MDKCLHFDTKTDADYARTLFITYDVNYAILNDKQLLIPYGDIKIAEKILNDHCIKFRKTIFYGFS